MPQEQKLRISRAKRGRRIKGGPRASIIGEKNPFYGKQHTPESIRKQSEAVKNCWLREGYVRQQMKSRGTRPNRKELWLGQFIQELGLPYQYVGDGQFILGGKCPDFLNTNGQEKLIELYGEYFHRGQNPQERVDYFAYYGFQTLIIWEQELESQRTLKDKLLQFEESAKCSS